MLRVAREVAVAPHWPRTPCAWCWRRIRAISWRHRPCASSAPRREPARVAVAGCWAQVRALLEDRFNVARDDLRAIAAAALRHP